MKYLARQHLSTACPFRVGLSAPAIGLMAVMTRGWEFPWRGGGVALVRRQLYPSPGNWMFCGLAYGSDTQIRNYKNLGHSAGQAYQYTAVVILGNGMISQMCAPVRVEFDAGGDLITPAMPSGPVSVVATPIDGGKFRLTWEYDGFGHGAYPKDFQVFEGPDAGSVDYNTPLGTVSYTGRGRVFTFTTGAYSQWSAHVFAVRARNASGVAEKNTYTTAIKRARATAPAAAPAPQRLHVVPASRADG